MLSPNDKEMLLNDFPNIKLSYEIIIHKTVCSLNNDILLIAPEGKKCFMWFVYFKETPTCFMLDIHNNIKIVNACFSSSLCYGTIFYGTLFHHLHNNF